MNIFQVSMYRLSQKIIVWPVEGGAMLMGHPLLWVSNHKLIFRIRLLQENLFNYFMFRLMWGHRCLLATSPWPMLRDNFNFARPLARRLHPMKNCEIISSSRGGLNYEVEVLLLDLLWLHLPVSGELSCKTMSIFYLNHWRPGFRAVSFVAKY